MAYAKNTSAGWGAEARGSQGFTVSHSRQNGDFQVQWETWISCVAQAGLSSKSAFECLDSRCTPPC